MIITEIGNNEFINLKILREGNDNYDIYGRYLSTSSSVYFSDFTSMEDYEILIELINNIPVVVGNNYKVWVIPVITEDSKPELLEKLFRFAYDKENPLADSVLIENLILPESLVHLRSVLPIKDTLTRHLIQSTDDVVLGPLPKGFVYNEKVLMKKLIHSYSNSTKLYDICDPRISSTYIHFGKEVPSSIYDDFTDVRLIYMDEFKGVNSSNIIINHLRGKELIRFNCRNNKEDLEAIINTKSLSNLTEWLEVKDKNHFSNYTPRGEFITYLKILLKRMHILSNELKVGVIERTLEANAKRIENQISNYPDPVQVNVICYNMLHDLDSYRYMSDSLNECIFNDHFYNLLTNRKTYKHSTQNAEQLYLQPVYTYFSNLRTTNNELYQRILYDFSKIETHGYWLKRYRLFYNETGITLYNGKPLLNACKVKDTLEGLTFNQFINDNYYVILNENFTDRDKLGGLINTFYILENLDLESCTWMIDAERILKTLVEDFSSQDELIEYLGYLLIGVESLHLLDYYIPRDLQLNTTHTNINKISTIFNSFGDRFIPVVTYLDHYLEYITNLELIDLEKFVSKSSSNDHGSRHQLDSKVVKFNFVIEKGLPLEYIKEEMNKLIADHIYNYEFINYNPLSKVLEGINVEYEGEIIDGKDVILTGLNILRVDRFVTHLFRKGEN